MEIFIYQGYRLLKVKCSQGGHKLTNDLLRKVFLDKKITQLY